MSEMEEFSLINPDAYDYLDQISEEAFNEDVLLEEQEAYEDSKLFDDDDESQPQISENDDSARYANDLFSFDYDEPQPEPEPEPEPKPEPEPEQSVEPVQVSETEPEITESEVLGDILHKISKYSPVKDFFRSCTEEQLKEIEQMIIKAKEAWLVDKTDKMFSIPESALTFAVVKDKGDPLVEIQRLEAIAVNMVAHKKDLWSAVYIYFNEDGSFKDARDRQVQKYLFTERQWKIVEILGKNQAQKLGL